MHYTVGEIAKALGVTAEGDLSLKVSGVAEPQAAEAHHIALAMKPEFAAMIPEGGAKVAMLWAGADWRGMGLAAALSAPRPRFALSGLSAMMDAGQGYAAGVHPSAHVDPTAELGEGVSLGPFSFIGAGARIGSGSVIGPQCLVGDDVTLGEGALLHAGARIMARVTVGARFIGHPGCVIGGDGFSFVTPEPSGVEKARASLGGEGTDSAQSWARIASLGAVTLGNDVEIGCNSCVDRGTVRDTRIGNGVKMDNLVQIGHNVVIGDDTMVCAGAAIAGSSVLGRGVVVGGCAGVSDNLRIGDRVILGGGTMVLSNVPEGRVMLGYPAMKMDAHVESYKGLRRLPRLFRDVADLKKAVFNTGGTD
ncbi:UDP-3-O-(3-hydroxymyristoyl)glucosamine N-acyltransferase [Sagittula salina]|uniref:UDP-3-O-(3-hydroxymyristoyl)glucosamine N-acyltransferase n=1 Tax=Sagittula salina TaxID=2820268 RepID=A0A940MLK6_9RHOB|nr:UDP-3-O-(3-hydroxymyristoyl)glucosamine N-acyltransferase [Sagittula salina]MBP0481995.1 UDP-3-O-(3-hydroxymyristoyl)glucosamine N-acyltransferase [Sagittula salina]